MRHPFDDFEGTPYDESVISIVGLHKSREGFFLFLGSGFFIAPFLAVTAKHVVDGYIKEYQGITDFDTWGTFFVPDQSQFDLFASQPKGDQVLGRPFKIDLISISAFSDFAVLRLIPLFREVDYVWRPYNLIARYPNLGSQVTAFGRVTTTFTDSYAGELYKHVKHSRTGVVKEIHERQRDSSLLRFPCFETDVRYEGAMSGGPVFSQSEYVVGMVCSSLSYPSTEQEGTETHYSHAATLWPFLSSIIQITDQQTTAYPHTFTIQQLARRGYVQFFDHDRIRVTLNSNGIPSGIDVKQMGRKR